MANGTKPVKLERHQLYKIVWIDAFISPTPWRTLDEISHEANEENRTGCSTAGFFVKRQGRLLIFASGFGEGDDPVSYFNAFAIPRSWIKTVELLK